MVKRIETWPQRLKIAGTLCFVGGLVLWRIGQNYREPEVNQPPIKTVSKTLPVSEPKLPALSDDELKDRVKRIFASLNAGKPEDLKGLLADRWLSQIDTLNRLCPPFGYRAHYVEKIERTESPPTPPGDDADYRRYNDPNQKPYAVHVRVLLTPFEEKSEIFELGRTGIVEAFDGLLAIDSEGRGSLGTLLRYKENTIHFFVVKFLTHTQEGNREEAKKLVSPKLDITAVFKNRDAPTPKELKRFSPRGHRRQNGVGLTHWKGIRFLAVLVSSNDQGDDKVLWKFLVDENASSYRIVGIAYKRINGDESDHDYTIFPEAPANGVVVDPDVEQYTLQRFGLVSPTEQEGAKK